jgi:hypothetical protein
MGQKQSVKILDIEYVIPKGADLNDTDTLMLPLQRKDDHYILPSLNFNWRDYSETYD